MAIIPGISKTLEFIILLAIGGAISAIIIIFLFRRIRRYGDYAYTNARISAMKGKLFRKDNLNKLTQTRNLKNLISLMEDSQYFSNLKGIKEPSPRKIELSINKNRADSYRKIHSIAPNEIEDIFQEIERIVTIRNIKNILTGKYVGASQEKIEERLYPPRFLPEEVYDKATDANSIREAVRALEGTRYWDCLNEAMDRFEENRNLLYFCSSLEEKYWSDIWRKIKISSEKSTEVLKKAVGTEIDLNNIITVLRCKAEKVGSERIKEFIIPIHSEIKENTLEKSIEAKNLKDTLNILGDSAYENIISEAQNRYEEKNSIFALEKTIKEFLLRRLRTLSIQHSTGAGPIIAFLHEKEIEAGNIITIANGKAEGLESEEIKGKTISPEAEW